MPKAEIKPRTRYTGRVGDTHNPESLLQCPIGYPFSKSREQGEVIPDEYLKHLSPVAWEHISLTGEYVWNLKQQTSLDALRPLRVT